MKSVFKGAFVVASSGLLLLLAVWGIARGRTEQAKEREREAPISVPPKLEALPGGGEVIKLEPEAQKALGLTTVELKERTVQAGVPIAGVILDPLPFEDLFGKLRAARAQVQAASASTKAAKEALDRTQALNQDDKGASDKALQEAVSRLHAEEAKAAASLAEAERLEASWRQQGIPADLAPFLTFRQALVRLELPFGQSAPPHLENLSVRVAEEARPRSLRVFGLASAAAPGTGGMALLGAMEGTDLRPGQPVEAFLPLGTPCKGIVPPASSLLRYEGRVWAYVLRPDGRFERRALNLLHPEGDSYAVEGLQAGEHVVTRGAEELLAEEFRSQIKVGEEDR